MLLDQKNVLAQEGQHRVRNNLQLIYGMLSKQLDDTRIYSRAAGHQGDRAPGDHLPGNAMTRTTDFGAYVKSLCHSLAEFKRRRLAPLR